MSVQCESPEFSSKGYLKNFDAWNRDIAKNLAKEHNLELTECHWHVIDFLRDYFQEYGIAPEPREVIKKIGKKINPNAPCSRHKLESLFAPGGCKIACQIAGLPRSYCRSC